MVSIIAVNYAPLSFNIAPDFFVIIPKRKNRLPVASFFRGKLAVVELWGVQSTENMRHPRMKFSLLSQPS